MADSKFKTRIKAEAGVQLPAEVATRALVVDGSGNITSSTVTTSELEQLAGLDLTAEFAAKADQTEVDALVSLTGVASGSTDLGTFAGSIIPDASTIKDALQALETDIENIPNPIFYAGTYDASTNTPDLDLVGARVNGALYRVTVAGTHDFGAFGGSITFVVGDKAVYNGSAWEKWDVSDEVLSVNGQTGVVVLDTDDVAEGSTNLYFTDARAKAAAVVDSTAGSETDQAASVSSMKSYVSGQISAIDLSAYYKSQNDLQVISTSGGTTAVSGHLVIAIGSSAETLTLPTTSGKFVSEFIAIVNRSSNTLTVNTFNSSSLVSIPANWTSFLRILSTASDGSAAWAVITFPTADSVTGDLKLSGKLIKGLGDGVDSTDAVNKGQLDTAIASVAGNPNDIPETSFLGANNQSSFANVTGLVFPNTLRGFKALVTVTVDADSDLFESFELLGVQKGAGWDMSQSSVGDSSGVAFTITSGGQVQYMSSNYAGFVELKIKFRAIVLAV